MVYGGEESAYLVFRKRRPSDERRVTNDEPEDDDSRAVYLVRGSVLSFLFVKPNKRDRPDRPDKPDPRHAPSQYSCLKPSKPSVHPRATNYTNVGVAQGIADVDFGFIEPALLATIAKTAKDGPAAPKGLDGTLVTLVAMGVDVLARLHQQIQQVLVGLRDARQPKPKA